LLGVVLLRSLAERLKTFEANKRNEIESVDEENLARLLEALTANQDQLHRPSSRMPNKAKQRGGTCVLSSNR
jgi:hypothetical protein